MNKKIIISTLVGAGLTLFAGTVSAISNDLTVRVYQPKTPTNLSEFKLNFVALDMQNRSVTVKCFKKGPSDANFTQFDDDKILKAGGNSGFCNVKDGIIGGDGTYQFYVSATSDMTVESSKVNVDYNKSTPGTPSGYSKEQINSCEYRIKVKTADDGDRTKRISLYRSENPRFDANPGAEVEAREVGSNTVLEMTNRVSDCTKTYYFAVRAWDAIGNGSGLVGDDNTTVTLIDESGNVVTSTSNTSQNQDSEVQILKDDTADEASPSTSTNTENTSGEPTVLGSQSETKTEWWKNPKLYYVLGLLGVIIMILRRKQK